MSFFKLWDSSFLIKEKNMRFFKFRDMLINKDHVVRLQEFHKTLDGFAGMLVLPDRQTFHLTRAEYLKIEKELNNG